MSGKHLDIETLSDYFLGNLPTEEETAVQQHLCECEDCRRQMEHLRALRDGFFGNGEPAHIRKPMIIRVLHSHIFHAAAAIILICGIGLLLSRNISHRDTIYQEQYLNNGKTPENEVFAIDTFDKEDSIHYGIYPETPETAPELSIKTEK